MAWQWVVQVDGHTPRGAPVGMPGQVAGDARVSLGAGRAGRAAMARTTALARVRGQLLRMLDADDLLTPGAWPVTSTSSRRGQTSGWTGCAALDLLPDGSLVKPFPDLLPAGAIAPGALLHSYRDPPSEHPVVVADTERPVVAVGRG